MFLVRALSKLIALSSSRARAPAVATVRPARGVFRQLAASPPQSGNLCLLGLKEVQDDAGTPAASPRGALLLAAGAANAQAYPAKPITMLCWSAAGSPVDLYARIMAKLLSATLGKRYRRQRTALGHRDGQFADQAPADGYTIAANTITLAALFSEPTSRSNRTTCS